MIMEDRGRKIGVAKIILFLPHAKPHAQCSSTPSGGRRG